MSHNYTKPASAAARWMRLYGELPGQIQGIDYERLHMAMCDSSPVAEQDVAFDRLDEFRELTACFMRAKHVVGWELFQIWLLVRVVGATQGTAAKFASCCTRTVRNRLRRVDDAVRNELIERDLTTGYAGRDMLEAGGRILRTVRVWLNEGWDEEVPNG